MRFVSPAEAVASIKSNQRLYLHGGAATPQLLVNALVDRAGELRDVEIVHLHTDAPAPYVAIEMQGHFRHNALFIGPNVRTAVAVTGPNAPRARPMCRAPGTSDVVGDRGRGDRYRPSEGRGRP